MPRRTIPFVGREHELAALVAHLAAVAAGQRGAVLPAGEPGVGNTRLLTELSEQATAGGWLVLSRRAGCGD